MAGGATHVIQLLTAAGLAVTTGNCKLSKDRKAFGRGVLVGFRRRATPFPLPPLPPAAPGTGTAATTSAAAADDAAAADGANDADADENDSGDDILTQADARPLQQQLQLEVPQPAGLGRRPPSTHAGTGRAGHGVSALYRSCNRLVTISTKVARAEGMAGTVPAFLLWRSLQALCCTRPAKWGPAALR